MNHRFGFKDIDMEILKRHTTVKYVLESLEKQISGILLEKEKWEKEKNIMLKVEDALLEFLSRTEEGVSRLSFAVNLFLQHIFPDLTLILKTQKDEDGVISGIQFLVSDGSEVRPVYEFYGASVVEVIFFALTVLLSILAGQPRIVAIDEPLKSLSEENWWKTMELTSSLCQKYDIQIIITTHHDCSGLKHFSNISVYNITGDGPEGRQVSGPGNGSGHHHGEVPGAERTQEETQGRDACS